MTKFWANVYKKSFEGLPFHVFAFLLLKVSIENISLTKRGHCCAQFGLCFELQGGIFHRATRDMTLVFALSHPKDRHYLVPLYDLQEGALNLF